MPEPVRSLSIFFPAGDFAKVLRDHAAGAAHGYGTHGEVARLVDDLRSLGIQVTLYSFMTPEARSETPSPGVRIVAMGARAYNQSGLLARAVAADDSDAIIPHFPNVELLHAVLRRGKPTMAIIANSFNREGPRSRLTRWRTMRLLRRFALVSNHCPPATQALAARGLDPERLIAWDVPHPYRPEDWPAKDTLPPAPVTIAYAGSVTEEKGVGDLIRAIALLRRGGMEVRATIVGNGELAAMRALAAGEGVADPVDLPGPIANERVFALFREAALVAVPSRTSFPEGFPLTMIEAIAARTPIVCSDHPMFRPIMTDGTRAFVFRSGDPVSLADAVRRAAASDEGYVAVSQAADATWAALSATADWRTLVNTWVTEGADAPWIRERVLARRSTWR